MTVQMECDDIRERALIERYVAGRLSEEEASELEAHYLVCQRCQADVRLAMAIRSSPIETARRPFPRWTTWGLAAAAGIGVVLLLVRPGHGSAERLGRILGPPAYAGVPVRGVASRGDSLFDAGMGLYSARRYGEAVATLDEALRAGADSAPGEFFRAASLLMMNRDADAAEGFRRVGTLGPSPYLPESYYYRAKALLRLGRSAEAENELHRIADGGPELARQASLLADSIDKLK